MNKVFRLRGHLTYLANNYGIKSKIQSEASRTFSSSKPLELKKISVTKEGKVYTIEGKKVEENHKNVVKVENPEGYCPMCPNKLGFQIDYTDILVISQFVRADGCMLPRYATGLCEVAHYRMRSLVHKAQRAGLMPEYRPPLPSGKERTGLKSGYKWKQYNAYYNPGKMPYEIPY